VGAGVFGATISGGGAGNYQGLAHSNRVDADFSSVGGGIRNTIQTDAPASTIGGGSDNTIQTSASESTVGGGLHNTIQTNSFYSTIGGGSQNTIQPSAAFSTIGGGSGNTIQSSDSTIAGGTGSTIQTGASASTIGGGSSSTIQIGSSLSTIGGGQANRIQTNAPESTIGGGAGNAIQTGASFSTIGGGEFNTISGRYGTVPGGDNNVAGTNSFAAGHRAKANHTGAFVWADSSGADFASSADNQFSIRATGGVRLSDNTPNLSFGSTTRQMVNLFSSAYGLGVQDSTFYQRSNFRFSWFVGGTHSDLQNAPGAGGSVVMTLTSSGLIVNGSTCCSSDRNVKENFTPVEPREVLERVAALPISRWNYKNDAGTPHLGPMSQDFYAAFGVGPDNKHIATVDADGVALAAIQGLNQKLEEARAENAELKHRLEKLEQLFDGKSNGGVK
jgi:hypothetical protein